MPFLIYDENNDQKQKYKHFCERTCDLATSHFNSGKDLFEYFVQQ